MFARMMTALAAALCLCLPAPGPARAEGGVIDPTTFGTEAIGKTYWFSEGGLHYGAEQFFEDNVVIWQGSDGMCKGGTWYAQGSGMCFVYEDDPTPHCWLITREEGRVFARSLPAPGAPTGPDEPFTRLELVLRSPLPLSCTGPVLGV